MQLADGIRKHGFRKWYERELLQSHAHLALTFLCGIGVAASMELAFKVRGPADQLSDLSAVLLCASVGIWALRRYLFLLMRAELIATHTRTVDERACGGVGTEGRDQDVLKRAGARLRVVVERLHDVDEAGDGVVDDGLVGGLQAPGRARDLLHLVVGHRAQHHGRSVVAEGEQERRCAHRAV